MLSCPPGHVALLATAEGYASGFASRTAPASEVEVDRHSGFEHPRRRSSRNRGSRVVDITVRARTSANITRQASSDGAGRFVIAGLTADTYQLEARGAGWFGVYPATIALSVADSAEDVVITVKKVASIRGTLLAEDESPCPHGQVYLGRGPGNYSVPVLDAVSTSQGAVLFEAVPPGRYQVSIGCRIGDTSARSSRSRSEVAMSRAWCGRFNPNSPSREQVVDERGQAVPGYGVANCALTRRARSTWRGRVLMGLSLSRGSLRISTRSLRPKLPRRSPSNCATGVSRG